jgi:hypothetical protein
MQKKNRKVEKKSDFEKKKKKGKSWKKKAKKKREGMHCGLLPHCIVCGETVIQPHHIYIYIILPICFVIINLYRIILNGQNLPIIYHFLI